MENIHNDVSHDYIPYVLLSFMRACLERLDFSGTRVQDTRIGSPQACREGAGAW